MSRRLPVSLFIIIILVLTLMSVSALAFATGSSLPWPEQQETIDAAIDNLLTQTAQAQMQMDALGTIDAAFPGELTRTAAFGATVDMGLQLTLTAFIEGSATPTASLTLAPSNTPTASPTAVPSKTLEPTLTATMLEPTQATADTPTATLNVAVGPVRAEPLPGAATLVELEVGAVVTALGRAADGNWLFVRTADGVTGWMSRSLLTIDFNLVNALPVVTGEADIATAAPLSTEGNASMYALMPIYDRPDSVNGEQIAEAQRGDRVMVLGVSEDGRFFNVRLADGTEGWVLSGTVNYDGDEAELPIIDDVGLALTSTPVGTAQIAATLYATNIRKEPNTFSALVTVLPPDTVVTVLGRTENSSYVYVRAPNGDLGWVLVPLLEPGFDLAVLPVLDPNNPVVPEELLSPTATPPQPTATPSITALSSATPAATTDEITAIVVASFVSVRAEPDIDAETLAELRQDDVVTVLGRSEPFGYLYVRTADGVEGWVSQILVQPSGTLAEIPIIEADSAQSGPTPTQIGADSSREVPGTLNISSANIRIAPELGSEPVARLSQGDAFVVLGRTANGNYVYARTADGVEGWLALRFVDLDVEPNELPVITPATP